MIDESTPVLVGVGQVSDRAPELRDRMSPLQLLRAASDQAARDAGLLPSKLADLDLIAVVKSFRNDLRNPPAALRRALGATRARAYLSTTGGNTPQLLVNRTAEAIARGEVGFALLCGAEALDTFELARARGVTLAWDEPDLGEPEVVGEERRGSTKQEHYHGLSIPAFCYPLFENALRGHYGRSISEHQRALGELFARFTEVAAEHPGAWFPRRRTAAEIAEPNAGNRFVAFPYTKYMNAMNTVNQSAAVLMTSVGQARSLGIASERLVYLHGCADAHDHFYVLDRVSYATSPAIRSVGREALRMAEVGIEDIALFDLYSCFPSAVQIARDMLGIASDDVRPLTVTGGLPYHGGAGNDFTMHAIATMATRLRAQPGALGLVTGNGYYLTVHSAGIYGTVPPRASLRAEPWRRRDPNEYQAELDAEAHPTVAPEPSGPARIETYTVVYDREGAPTQGIVVGRLADERRFVAHTPSDRSLLEGLTTRDALGLRGRAEPGERVNRFTPE